MASHFCLYHDIATGARLLQTFFMKRLITILCSLLACLSLVAQTNSDNTIKFLGIPIDGSKEQMIKELKNKGFKYNPQFENLSGRFNGKDSNIYISTNNGKVDRVYVASSVLEDEASFHTIIFFISSRRTISISLLKNPNRFLMTKTFLMRC